MLAILFRPFGFIDSNIAVMNVPDEGYYERTWWRLLWTYLIKVIMNVPDEGYYERTLWRLLWTYLMKVIPEARYAH